MFRWFRENEPLSVNSFKDGNLFNTMDFEINYILLIFDEKWLNYLNEYNLK